MRRPAPRHHGIKLAFLLAVCAFGWTAPILAEEDEGWRPQSKYEKKWDWLQFDTGEWVKGKITAMYNDELEFDSDHFDDLVIDWADVAQIRSSQVMNVGFTRHRRATGQLIVEGDVIRVVSGETVAEFKRSELLTLTAGAPREVNFWSAKLFAGVIVRTGNSEVREINLTTDIKRRTIHNRIALSAIVNQNTTDGEEITNNRRADGRWDRFVRDRVFVTPVFVSYLYDAFQNIDARNTAGIGIGYQLMDTKKVDWYVTGGPAYQSTRFISVAPGEPTREHTIALVLSSTVDWDITKKLELDGQYKAEFVDEASGGYNQHLSLSFEADITRNIDFDITWVWDRVQHPQPDEDGVVPSQDDIRTSAGLTFDF